MIYIFLLGLSALGLAVSLAALGVDPVVAGIIACALGVGLYLFVTPRRRR